MTEERPPITVQDVIDGVEDIVRCLGRLVTTAVGTCLGIALFLLLVVAVLR
jgi:hypothetical protein